MSGWRETLSQSSNPMILAKDLMNKTAVIVPEDMQITELVRVLRDNRIGGAPVQDKEGTVVGIVTVNNVFSALEIVRGMQKSKSMWLSLFRNRRRPIYVKDIYTREVVSVTPETPAEKVVEIMMLKNIHTIPVMSTDQRSLYGVIGRHDVTWAVFGLEEDARITTKTK